MRRTTSARVVPALVAARAVVVPAVRLTTLPTMMRWCRVVGQRSDSNAVVEVIGRIEAVWRRLPRGSGTCLTRSLWRLYAGRRAGLPLHFVIGVRMSATKEVEAHAWLELDGELFMEADPAVPAGFTRAFEDPSISTTMRVPSNAVFG